MQTNWFNYMQEEDNMSLIPRYDVHYGVTNFRGGIVVSIFSLTGEVTNYKYHWHHTMTFMHFLL